MSENGQVDLSLALPGDRCHRRNGSVEPFIGPTPENIWSHRKYPYTVGVFTYARDGRFLENRQYERDIVRVTRIVDGVEVQVTPAPAVPPANAGPEPAAAPAGAVSFDAAKAKSGSQWQTKAGVFTFGAMNPDAAYQCGDSAVVGWVRGMAVVLDRSGKSHHRGDEYSITGPYVEPPKPVLTLREAVEKFIAECRESDYEIDSWQVADCDLQDLIAAVNAAAEKAME